jgi:hypothetical protein
VVRAVRTSLKWRNKGPSLIAHVHPLRQRSCHNFLLHLNGQRDADPVSRTNRHKESNGRRLSRLSRSTRPGGIFFFLFLKTRLSTSVQCFIEGLYKMETQKIYENALPLANAPANDHVSQYSNNAGGTHPLSCLLSMIFPCSWCCSCYSVREQEAAIILQWGKFSSHNTVPGLSCSNPCGRSIIVISTRQISKELHNLKVVDARGECLCLLLRSTLFIIISSSHSQGNPLLISGVVRLVAFNICLFPCLTSL